MSMANNTQIIGQHKVELSNTQKVLFPDSGLTKGDLIEYYRDVADTMLPHVKGRPLAMHRFPDGIDDDGFFQQKISDYFPHWIARETVDKVGGSIAHVVCENAATLVYLANQACITPHIWYSRRDKLHYPDRMVFDLDPSIDDLKRLKRAVGAVKELLDELGLQSFVMTTGSRGFHVVVSLDRSQTFDITREFARGAADFLAAQHPDLLTTEQRKNKRGDRVFVDTAHNSYGHTGVAPYAVRAKPGAPVATPIDWGELGRTAPRDYTIENIMRRLGQKDDPWADIAQHAQSLDSAREMFAEQEGERSS